MLAHCVTWKHFFGVVMGLGCAIKAFPSSLVVVCPNYNSCTHTWTNRMDSLGSAHFGVLDRYILFAVVFSIRAPVQVCL